MHTYKQPVTCTLCNQKTIDPRNAQPLDDGECCADCDNTFVIPARTAIFAKEREIRAYVKSNGRVAARKHYMAMRQSSNNTLDHYVIDRFFALPKDDNRIQ